MYVIAVFWVHYVCMWLRCWGALCVYIVAYFGCVMCMWLRYFECVVCMWLQYFKCVVCDVGVVAVVFGVVVVSLRQSVVSAWVRFLSLWCVGGCCVWCCSCGGLRRLVMGAWVSCLFMFGQVFEFVVVAAPVLIFCTPFCFWSVSGIVCVVWVVWYEKICTNYSTNMI